MFHPSREAPNPTRRMNDKPIARILVPSMADYPREVIEARLPDYTCELVEDDYFIRPVLISMRGVRLSKGQDAFIAGILDLLYQERQSSPFDHGTS
jgi:hypothetical protein